jgi:hypothetical protein
MLCSLLFWGVFSVIPIQLTKAVVENGSDVGPFSPSAPSANSAGYLPIRIRRPFRTTSRLENWTPVRKGALLQAMVPIRPIRPIPV